MSGHAELPACAPGETRARAESAQMKAQNASDNRLPLRCIRALTSIARKVAGGGHSEDAREIAARAPTQTTEHGAAGYWQHRLNESERRMRATLMYEAGDVRIEDVPDSVIKEPTDALVRITAFGICGSDLWPYGSMSADDEPARMGHEFIGVVEDIG